MRFWMRSWQQDPKARVACETMVTTGMAVIAGEITTTANMNYPEIVRNTIKEIGYNGSEMGFDYETCAVLVSIDRQSPGHLPGGHRGGGDVQGAGGRRPGPDVRLCLQRNPELMPMPIQLSHQLVKRLADVRKSGS
jgi:S-adenosylmethionine synthetase